MAKQTNEDQGIRPGGYHDRGVPGEEGDVRRHMRVLKVTDSNRTVRRGPPIKGGGAAESTAAGRLEDELAGVERPEGVQEVFVLTRTGSDTLDTPIFRAGEDGKDEALAVFTERELAILYLQVAGWRDSHEIVNLSPMALGQLVREARADGVNLVAIDLNRKSHLEGTPQAVLHLEQHPDLSDQNLYREIQANRLGFVSR